jgi:uncharacterized lipoprotein YbaY
MRNVIGDVVLPANITNTKAGVMIVEVRDVSMMDVPSKVIAEQRLSGVTLEPNGRIHFELQTPDLESNRSLALRVHISMDGSGQVKSGDLLTTTNYPVPTSGAVPYLEVTTNRI